MPDPLIPATNGDEYLRLLMIPDPAAALGCLAAGLAIRLIGAHAMREPAEVCSLGALHGKWLDGVLFDCNRYVDRHEVRQDLIARTDLRNDSAACLPDRTARGSCQ